MSPPLRKPRAVRESAERVPADLRLMLCTLVAEPFDDLRWVFEPKLDGLRVICLVDGGAVGLVSRNGRPQVFQFPDVVAAIQKCLGGGPAILDGEIVCLD